MNMTDIQAKYQKLAAEYAKVRSQVPVLKKAVLEEQSKEEARKDEIKTRDQALRKYEQEVESLTFRNQQLSARVSVLQGELDTTGAKSKKQKKVNHTVTEVNHSAQSVLTEELQNKIEENAKLHGKLQDLDDYHKNETDRLQARLTQLELDAGSHQHELDHSVSQYTHQIDRLREDKVLIEIKLQKREHERRETEQKLEQLEEELCRVKTKLSTELTQAHHTVRQKILFNDACESRLKSLDMPVYNREHQLHCKEVIGQMYVFVHDFVHALSNLYTYLEHRLTSYPRDSSMEPLSQNSITLCKYLHENASHLRPIERAYKQFSESVQDDMVTTLDTMNEIQAVSVTFNKAVAYISKLLPYQILGLEEENSASMCSRSLQVKNKELQSAYTSLESVLSKVDTSVTTIVLQSSATQGHPVSSHPKLLSFLSKSVADLNVALEEFTKHFHAKMNLEHELPTFTENLKVTNDCIRSTLLALVNITGKMDKFFKTNLVFLCQPVVKDEDLYVKSHPATVGFRKRSSEFMASLARACPESVPHSTALHNRKTLYSSTESRDSLALQVVALQEKLNKTEQAKEHWMLETKLIQMKFEKECQKLVELQTRLGSSGAVQSSATLVIPAVPVSPSSANVPGGRPDFSVLGRVERSMSEERDVDAREQFIKQHYTEKIAHLMVQLQAADSKALNFHAECRALHKRLLVTHCDKDKLQSELEKAQQNVAQLKDELQVTTRNYEGQLSMMSEHLAGMNERLTTQADEINTLKYQIQQQTKSSKRSFLGK